jgi:hypothetical protein
VVVTQAPYFGYGRSNGEVKVDVSWPVAEKSVAGDPEVSMKAFG